MIFRNRIRQVYLKTFKSRYYQKHQEDLDLYLELVPPGSLCFDVGANRGDKTKAMLFAGMKVVSFEPQPECIHHLRQHCAAHAGRLRSYASAVGGQEGEATLYLAGHVGEASLNPQWTNSAAKKSMVVPVTTLDIEISRHGRPYYCKIDVEGHEWEVFQGLTQPLPMISFEYHLNEENVARTLKCLDYLSLKADYLCNLAGAERGVLQLDPWLPIEKFKTVFPGQFEGLRPFRYGDIFLKMK